MANDDKNEISKYRRHLETIVGPRREKIRKDARRSAIWCSVFGTAIFFIPAGMPGHRFARWLGVPLMIAFVIAFSVLLSTCANIVLDRLLRKD
jgi:hypothetical protein